LGKVKLKTKIKLKLGKKLGIGRDHPRRGIEMKLSMVGGL